jgi:hypothetical protein
VERGEFKSAYECDKVSKQIINLSKKLREFLRSLFIGGIFREKIRGPKNIFGPRCKSKVAKKS